jgi:hypothetical protein
MKGIYFILPVFLLGVIASVFILFKNGQSLINSLIPEVFGFFLEGIFFVLIFKYFEERRNILLETKRKEELKNTLLSFLGCYFYWADKDSDISNIKLDDFKKTLNKLNQEIVSGKSETFASYHTIDLAKHQLEEIRSLLPIAAQIGATHLFHWSLIQLSVSNLANANDGPENSLILLKKVIQDIYTFSKLEIKPGHCPR